MNSVGRKVMTALLAMQLGLAGCSNGETVSDKVEYSSLEAAAGAAGFSMSYPDLPFPVSYAGTANTVSVKYQKENAAIHFSKTKISAMLPLASISTDTQYARQINNVTYVFHVNEGAVTSVHWEDGPYRYHILANSGWGLSEGQAVSYASEMNAANLTYLQKQLTEYSTLEAAKKVSSIALELPSFMRAKKYLANDTTLLVVGDNFRLFKSYLSDLMFPVYLWQENVSEDGIDYTVAGNRSGEISMISWCENNATYCLVADGMTSLDLASVEAYALSMKQVSEETALSQADLGTKGDISLKIPAYLSQRTSISVGDDGVLTAVLQTYGYGTMRVYKSAEQSGDLSGDQTVYAIPGYYYSHGLTLWVYGQIDSAFNKVVWQNGDFHYTLVSEKAVPLNDVFTLTWLIK